MSTAMRDFYKAIGELNGSEEKQLIVRSYFENLTEEEQDFVFTVMSAEVCDAIH